MLIQSSNILLQTFHLGSLTPRNRVFGYPQDDVVHSDRHDYDDAEGHTDNAVALLGGFRPFLPISSSFFCESQGDTWRGRLCNTLSVHYGDVFPTLLGTTTSALCNRSIRSRARRSPSSAPSDRRLASTLKNTSSRSKSRYGLSTCTPSMNQPSKLKTAITTTCTDSRRAEACASYHGEVNIMHAVAIFALVQWRLDARRLSRSSQAQGKKTRAEYGKKGGNRADPEQMQFFHLFCSLSLYRTTKLVKQAGQTPPCSTYE